jgi:hypothetical protein
MIRGLLASAVAWRRREAMRHDWSEMTTLRLDFDPVWAEADLESDPLTAAQALVLERWKAQRRPIDAERAQRVAGELARMLLVLRTENPPPALALLLYPKADDSVVTVATLRAQAFDETLKLGDVVAELRLPPELAPVVEESELPTPGGPAVRLVQRHGSPGAEQEHVVYVWLLDDEDGSVVITLSTAFEDAAEGGRWRPALDGLARGLTLGAGPRA